jgi:hypothetical protein
MIPPLMITTYATIEWSMTSQQNNIQDLLKSYKEELK